MRLFLDENETFHRKPQKMSSHVSNICFSCSRLSCNILSQPFFYKAKRVKGKVCSTSTLSKNPINVGRWTTLLSQQKVQPNQTDLSKQTTVSA